MTNHLSNENSPYLLQHASNPVEWYPWGPEALARAIAENKPIFLSIGYAACHWCHVMAHESFEDQAIADLMNAHFINIKVDREERPDLDSIYMSATIAMTGSGGWPMSVFLTPDLKPFYAGTYFPPVRRFNMPSFRELLMGIAQTWLEQPDETHKVGTRVTEHIQKSNKQTSTHAFPLSHALLATAADTLVSTYDWGFGGWGEAPKFPQPMTIEFLLAFSSANPGILPPSKSQKYIETACHVLKAMARGGMYDVVGGGFARYSVDNLWKTPHFEKMLYDNAQLALAYLHAYLATGDKFFRRVCVETLDFMLREMRHPGGGFYSSLDADSEGHEGKFYLWTVEEIQTILADEFDFFQAAYGLNNTRPAAGNHELDGIILQRSLDDTPLAARFKLDEQSLALRLAACQARLLEARSKRVRPTTDDKILTGWNGLALAAFAEAGRYLDRPDYLETAAECAHFLLNNLRTHEALLRSWRAGSARHTALLEDYAALVLGLLALYQSQPDPEWYTQALRLADEIPAHFANPDGGFFDTRDDHDPLLLRPADTQDNAIPSGSALAVAALLQIAEYGDRPEWHKMASDALAGVLEPALRFPTAFSRWLSAADFALGPVSQVALLGDPGLPGTLALRAKLWGRHRPRQVVAISPYPPSADSPALLKDRPLLNGQPTVYVCQNFTCQLPVTDPTGLAAQLA
jgi:uncharacterized protein YyaL (SSP411 family)